MRRVKIYFMVLWGSRRIFVQRIARSLRKAPFIPIFVLVAFVFVGLFGKMITLHNPNEANFEQTLRPPFWQEKGTIDHPLGTDQLGRDILSRLICGAGVSLQVGFVVVVVAGLLGTTVALLSGFLGGWIDIVLMRLTDTMLSMPYLIVAIVLAAVLGPSKTNIILVLTIMGWAGYARVLRGEVLRIKQYDFVLIAITSGASKLRIMFIDVFPNIINTLVILGTLQLGVVIISEASLSFLGVGVPPPNPAWGLMVAEGRSYLTRGWWLSTCPGVAILLVVMSCNLLGDWLRVRLDPKFRQL